MSRAERLLMLQELARLRAERAAARLAQVQGLINTLEEQAEGLRQGPKNAPVTIQDAIVQDRWARLRAQSLGQLNTQIARLQGATQPQRELFARETARKNVLAQLAKKS